MADRDEGQPNTMPDSRLARALERAAQGRIVSAYLFGSVARGTAHRESDVDVGVLFSWNDEPTKQRRFEAALPLTAPLEAAMGRRVDLVVLNDAPPLLAREIVTRGRRILCADMEIDHAFVRDTQLRAADLAPYLERARRVKLAALTG